MPMLLPDSPSPRPPVLPEEPQRALQILQRYAQQQAVWLQQQFDAIRGTQNWLVGQQNIRNLVPDSDLRYGATYWTVGGGWAITDAVGEGGGRGFTLTGSPAGTVSAQTTTGIPVMQDLYILSGWIDARAQTAGVLSWQAINQAAVVIGEAKQVIGQTGRVEQLITIPAGTTTVVFAMTATNVVIPSGTVVASQPQFELPQAGHTGVTAPSATLYRSNVGQDL